MSSQPPPPFGQQPEGSDGGQPPQWGGTPPGYGGPEGYGGQQTPPGYGGQQPPPGYGGTPPGFGVPGQQGPQGFGQPPSGSGGGNAGLIIGIVAAIVVIAGGVGVFLLTSGDDDGDVAIDSSPAETATASPTPEDSGPTTPAPTPTAATPTEAAPTATAPEATASAPAPAPSPAPTLPPEATDPAPPAAPPPSGGQSMAMGDSATGEITNEVEGIEYFFDGTAGANVEITMMALDESLDPVLELYGPNGDQIERNDDFDFSESRDSRISTSLPVDGEYRIVATSFAGSTGPFEVTLSFPSVLSASDRLSDAVPEISYEYEGAPGQRIIIDMVATEDGLDPLLRLIGPDGSQVADDDDSGEGLNARIDFTVTESGTYTIVASSFASTFGGFDITVSEF